MALRIVSLLANATWTAIARMRIVRSYLKLQVCTKPSGELLVARLSLALFLYVCVTSAVQAICHPLGAYAGMHRYNSPEILRTLIMLHMRLCGSPRSMGVGHRNPFAKDQLMKMSCRCSDVWPN
jgi:hypothetical protein